MYLSRDSMLNLSKMTSTICTTCRNVNVDLQAVLYTELVGQFMMNLHTKFHLLRSNDSLHITIRMNAKITQQRLIFLEALFLHISGL